MLNNFAEKNLLCEIHNSPIGGVCSDSKCLEPPFIMCIKCVVDGNCCIRKFNHNLISMTEFFQNFFDSKKVEQFKDIITMHNKLQNYDLNKKYDKINEFADKENKKFSEISSKFAEKLHDIFLNETSKLKEIENKNLVNLKLCKDIIEDIQREFIFFSDETEEKFYDFEEFTDKLLKQYSSRQILIDEVYSKLKYYLTRFKSLLNKSNKKQIISARKIINSLVFSSFNINKNQKLEVEKKSKTICDNIEKEINSFFLNKEKQIIFNRSINLSENPISSKKLNVKKDTKKFAEQFNIFKNTSVKAIKNSTEKPSTKKSNILNLVEKEKKIESNSIKSHNTLILEKETYSKNKYNNLVIKKPIKFENEKKKSLLNKSPISFTVDASLELQPFQQLQQSKNKNFQNFAFLESIAPDFPKIKIDYINDDQAIVVDSYNIIAYSNNSELIIYDFKKKKYIFNLNLPGIFYTQKKYMVKNFEDYIYTLTSDNQILEIKISDYKLKQELSYKFYEIITCLTNFLPVFEMTIEEDSLFENLSMNFYFINADSSFFSGSLKDDKIILSIPFTFSTLLEVNTKICKLEVFNNELELIKNSDTENQNGKIKVISSNYIVINTGSIKILSLNSLSPVEYFKVSSVFPNNLCNSFSLENLKSTSETYLYTVWQNGSMLIYSLKNKEQIKKFLMPSQSTPLYSICYIDENNLIVGCENQMILLDNSNTNSINAIKFYKNLSGLIISIKIYIDKTQENFICFSNSGNVNLFSLPK